MSSLSDSQKKAWQEQVAKIRSTKLGQQIYDLIESDENWEVTVSYRANSSTGNFEYDPESKTLSFGINLSDTDIRGKAQEKGIWKHSIWMLTGHELWHAWDHYRLGDSYFMNQINNNYRTFRFTYLEPRAVKFQNYLFAEGNHLATEQNTPGLRTHYGQRKSFDKFGSYLQDFNDLNSKLESFTIKSNLDNFPSRHFKIYRARTENVGKILSPRDF